jgi:hypothetical protein
MVCVLRHGYQERKDFSHLVTKSVQQPMTKKVK